MTALFIILVILILILTIIVHEAGHFFAAKAVGVKAETFSIGFGPEIVGRDRGETHYAVKWVLAGGSVKILGMNPEEEISEEDKPRSYKAAPHWKRAVVILAGSAANIVMAFMIFYVVALGYGIPTQSGDAKIGPISKYYVIDGRKATTPSYRIGLKKGDVITEVNGVKVERWSDLTDRLGPNPGETVTIKVKRGSETMTLKPTLISVTEHGEKRGKLGISPYYYVEKYNPVTAVWGGAKLIGMQTAAIGKGLGSLFSVNTLKVLLGTRERSLESPQSIVGAARTSVELAGRGMDVFLSVMASIVLFIAIFNLIPLPPFDGGHLMVIIIEKVFKREVDMRKLAPVAWAVVIILSVVALRLAVLDIFSPIRLP